MVLWYIQYISVSFIDTNLCRTRRIRLVEERPRWWFEPLPEGQSTSQVILFVTKFSGYFLFGRLLRLDVQFIQNGQRLLSAAILSVLISAKPISTAVWPTWVSLWTVYVIQQHGSTWFGSRPARYLLVQYRCYRWHSRVVTSALNRSLDHFSPHGEQIERERTNGAPFKRSPNNMAPYG